MKQASLILAALLCGLGMGTVYGMNPSHVNYKLNQYLQEQKAEQMDDAMTAIGADLSNVTIEIRNRGNTVNLNGSVPTQDDLDRINLVVKKFGPFRNLRNYVTVKPYTAKDGVVVEMDMFKHIEHTAPTDTNDVSTCTICSGGDKCDKLYAEREELLKQLRPLVKRKITERYVVFDEAAAPMLKRFREISDLLDESNCFSHESAKK